MNSAYFQGLTPAKTPQTIKYLLLATAIISIFSALTQSIFTYFFFHGPHNVLSLSWLGLRENFFWQPLSYMFIQSGGEHGISFLFLVQLSFTLYFIWLLGSSIVERIGSSHFLSYYFSCGVFAGLIAVFMMASTGYYLPLAGTSAVLLGLFVIWNMLFPRSEIYLFLIFPINVAWMLGASIIFFLLIDLSHLDFVSFIYHIAGVVYGYFYGRIALKLDSPFQFTQRIEKPFMNKKNDYKPHPTNSKIIEITGEPVLTDDAFVDAMLTKISKKGESALTPNEKYRLEQISKKKQRRM